MLSPSESNSSNFFYSRPASLIYCLSWILSLAINSYSFSTVAVIYGFRSPILWIRIFIRLYLISLLSFIIKELPFQLFKIVFLIVKLVVSFVSNPTTKSQSNMQCGFFLYIIIAEKLTVLQLLSCKDNKLTTRRGSLFVMDLSFYVLNRVGGFNI